MISKLCDPVVAMAHGEVIAEGSMADIRENREVQEAYLGGGVSGRGVSQAIGADGRVLPHDGRPIHLREGEPS